LREARALASGKNNSAITLSTFFASALGAPPPDNVPYLLRHSRERCGHTPSDQWLFVPIMPVRAALTAPRISTFLSSACRS
jgi:hypothetical protein